VAAPFGALANSLRGRSYIAREAASNEYQTHHPDRAQPVWLVMMVWWRAPGYPCRSAATRFGGPIQESPLKLTRVRQQAYSLGMNENRNQTVESTVQPPRGTAAAEGQLARRRGESESIGTQRVKARGVGAQATGAMSVGALALGAMSVGALAIGALAIGRLAIKRLVVGRTRVAHLEIGELQVGRLTVEEVIVTRRCVTPERSAENG
jgi:hypothetical protein